MAGETIDVDGRSISITNLGKVLYPATGTRKFDVIDYYNRVADVMLPHLAGRILTRKRWPSGVESAPFFEKDLPDSAPSWITRHALEHSSRTITYAMASDRATLVWLAQMAALELHTPQWRVDLPTGPASAASGEPGTAKAFKADRLVLDLDPGPDVPLHRCAEVALLIHDLLSSTGMDSYPVTSGGKGIHVYARFDRPVAADSARSVAKQIATSLAALHPDSITATMAKSERGGRVFIDWSQNSSAKTTLAPYSLRGREQPWVAAPRQWSELADPDLGQLLYSEVLDRIDEFGDLIAELDADPEPESAIPTESPVPTLESISDAAPRPVVDLSEYRRKRDTSKTPEPFGDENTRARRLSLVSDSPVSDGDSGVSDGDSGVSDGEPEEEYEDDTPDTSGPMFVIQEHHATRLHYDFRLERDGVLVSWAIPKNLPDDPDQNRLAIATEDHPLDYADFEGDIPAGEYGGGHVEIWDRGTYETEKWRDSEIIVRLYGERIQGRYVLIKTGEKNWLAHLMTDEPRPIRAAALTDPRPMLATDDPVEGLGDDWAFEGKWDGYRIMVRYLDGRLTLTSRSGIDMTRDFPELHSIADALGLLDVILDGEVVALDSAGRTDFTLLSARSNTTEPYTLKLLLFDVLALAGKSVIDLPWSSRRQLLEELAPAFRGTRVEIPALLPSPGEAAVAYSREHNLEGVIAKRRSSTYQQGRRSSMWLKQKNWSDIEVVIGGYRPGRGNRANTIGSLLLGLPEETGLRYVGRVGTGFTDAQLTALAAELEPLVIRTCPFLDTLDRPVASTAVWVLPKIVGEVRFMDWTSTGHLRHPSWRGIRRDKLPGDL